MSKETIMKPKYEFTDGTGAFEVGHDITPGIVTDSTQESSDKASIENSSFIGRMFAGDDVVEEIDLSDYSFPNIIEYGAPPEGVDGTIYATCNGLFEGCPRLKRVVMPNVSLEAPSLVGIFRGDKQIEEIDFSRVDLSSIIDFRPDMFFGICYAPEVSYIIDDWKKDKVVYDTILQVMFGCPTLHDLKVTLRKLKKFKINKDLISPYFYIQLINLHKLLKIEDNLYDFLGMEDQNVPMSQMGKSDIVDILSDIGDQPIFKGGCQVPDVKSIIHDVIESNDVDVTLSKYYILINGKRTPIKDVKRSQFDALKIVSDDSSFVNLCAKRMTGLLLENGITMGEAVALLEAEGYSPKTITQSIRIAMKDVIWDK